MTEADLPREALRHLCLPHRGPGSRRLLPRAIGGAHDLSGTRPLQGDISNPKQNDYQSIHTTIVGPRHQRVDCKLHSGSTRRRISASPRMRSTRTNGADGRAGPVPGLERLSLAAHLVGMLLDGDNPEEFLEHTKLELFQDSCSASRPRAA